VFVFIFEGFMKQYRIGSDVDSWCTKCKLILAHTIEAIVGEDIKRVHCNTCLSKHIYRAYEPGNAPKVTRTTSLKSSRTKTGVSRATKKIGVAGMMRASDYELILRGRDLTAVKRYSFRDQYGAGEVLQHIEFGLGVVTADKGSNKIEVLFQLGPKVLVHGRSI
jgi:hypothetical protein